MKTRVFYMVMALVLTAALAVPLVGPAAAPAQAIAPTCDTTYNFDVCPCGGAWYSDEEDSAPPLDGSGPSGPEATGSQYTAIATSDDSRWETPDPGSSDYVFLWLEMPIAETPGDITNINLTFEGYGDGGTGNNFQIYAYNNDTTSWVAIGTSEPITEGSEETMTRSIPSNWADYIDGCGLLKWGVYYDESSENIWIDYVKAVVTAGGSTTYDFSNVTVTCPPNGYQKDVHSMGTGGPSVYSEAKVTSGEREMIDTSDDSRWESIEPGYQDYVFLQFEMLIAEAPGDITNIDLTFEGYGEISGTFQIWADDTTDGWVQIGISEEVPTGSDETVTRSITSNWADYINGSGVLTWGVFFNEAQTSYDYSGYWVKTDYVEAVVTAPCPDLPGINIDKTALESEVAAGETIHYTYNVTNDTGLGNITVVTVIDDTCTSPVRGVDNPGNDDNTLEDGETWVYTCEYVTTLADWLAGSVENEATANGTAPGAVPVQDKDTESVTVTEPANPPLTQACGLDIVLALDMSGSINTQGEEGTVKNAAKAFVDAFLPATPTLIGLVEFSDGTATVVQGLTDDEVDIKSDIDGLSASGYTNWEQALLLATGLLEGVDDRDDAIHPDLIVIITDGDPTDSSAGAANAGQPNIHLAPAIVAANAAKTSSSSQPIRIVAVGVGSSPSEIRLSAISGPNVAPPINVDTDVILTSFGDLADTLAELAGELCGGTIIIEKVTEPAGGTGFDFSGDLGAFSLDDGQNQEFLDQDAGAYNVTETVPDCWELDSVVCTGGDYTAITDGVTVHLDPGDVITCTFNNTKLEPVMTIDKDVVGVAPVGVAPGGTVQYTINVTNSGTCAATNVSIWDTLGPWFTYASPVSIVDTGTTRSPTINPTPGDTTPLWGYWIIPSGDSVIITFTADVDPLIPVGTYQNTAYADGDNFNEIDDEGPLGQDADTPPREDPEVDENVFVAEEPPPQVTGVPTLSQWGMIAMGILFAAFLIWTVRRRWVVSADGRQE